MARAFDVVFFDLGDTLLYDEEPWEPTLNQADAAMRQSLQDAGFLLSKEAYGEFDSIFDLYYHRRKDTLEEETTFQLLKGLMQDQTVNPPAPVLRRAIRALYAVTQSNWHLEPDAKITLAELQNRGYRLGVISNAADDENVQTLIDKAGLRVHLELALSSAASHIRKPDPRIFQIALEHFGIGPERSAMVGDTLEADILGANQMGIYSIWINRRSPAPPEGELQVQPRAVISSLRDLPALLEDIAKEDQAGK